MIKFETIKAGDVLWDCHRQRMGNTMMSRTGSWQVRVISVDAEARTAVVSWNNNAPTTYREHELRRLRRKKSKAALRDEGRRF